MQITDLLSLIIIFLFMNIPIVIGVLIFYFVIKLTVTSVFWKKYFRLEALFILLLILFGTVNIHLAPVSSDAGGCGGGYRRYVLDKHSEELTNLFLTEQGFNKNTNYKLVSEPDKVDWNGRNIYVTLKIEVEGKTYLIDYSGKKYWSEKYNWKIINIKM